MQCPIISLAEYRSLVSGLPAPTRSQMEAFTEFVRSAHSWYKHLPLAPPGLPFQFFLDPAAGMQRAFSSDDRLEVSSRASHGFHYSWIPTNEYRERFGHLAYSRSAGTSVSLTSTDGAVHVPSDDYPAVYDERRHRLVGLPREVLEAGAVSVSALVHTVSASTRVLAMRLPRTPDFEWPEESGGASTLQKIRERCREIAEDRSREKRVDDSDPRVAEDPDLTDVDMVLDELIAPERSRQCRQLVLAMERVCALVLTDAPGSGS